MSQGFPYITIAVPPSFEKCRLLNVFFKCISHLNKEIQIFLKRYLVSPYFNRLRMQSSANCELEPNEAIKNLLSCLYLCPSEDHIYLISAISLLSGLSIDFLVRNYDLNPDKKFALLMKAIVSSANEDVHAPYIDFFSHFNSITVKETIPTTFNWFLEGNPFLEMQEETESFIEEAFLSEIPEDMEIKLRYSHDLSSGVNPSRGLTKVPCLNDIDDQWPADMEWISDLEIPPELPIRYIGCDCEDCNTCHQMEFPDGKHTMHYKPDGRINIADLATHKPLVMECNPSCRCSPELCMNRVLQQRSKVHLCIYHSLTKSGWGVKTLDFVQKGSFICEYLGEVITDPQLAESIGKQYDLSGESYLFDLDAYGVDDSVMFTVDPKRKGNVSKFINHSCEPNLVQISIGTINSPLFHRVAFFAARNLFPNEELGFNYNYDMRKDRLRPIGCNCGSVICRTRLL